MQSVPEKVRNLSMANYETGINTKNRILDAYRELFYKQGYKKTTYLDIYNLTGINQGLITYYFKSKRAVAGQIHTELRKQIKNAVIGYFSATGREYDLRTATALEQIIYSRIKFSDENLKRFIYEISVLGIFMEYEISQLKDFWDLHVKEYHLNLSESEIKMIQVVNSSITWGITTKMIEGYLDVTADEFAQLRVKLMYQSLGLSDLETGRILEKSYALLGEMNFSLEDYFKIRIDPVSS